MSIWITDQSLPALIPAEPDAAALRLRDASPGVAVPAPPAPLAVLVNAYPRPSHTFIRREIHALEAAGERVLRFTVRPAAAPLPDPQDEAERQVTAALFDRPGPALAAAARAAVTRPLRFASALAAAAALARRTGEGPRAWPRHAAYLAQAARLREQLDHAGVRHLHAHFGDNAAAVALLTRRLGGPPFSFTVHGPEDLETPPSAPPPGRDPLSLTQKTAEAAFVAGVSAYGQRELAARVRPVHRSKVRQVRCGLPDRVLDADPPAWPAATTGKDGPPRTLLFVGRLVARKQPAELCEAFADALTRDGAAGKLILCGDGPERERVEAVIAERDLAPHVHLAGWADDRAVRDQLGRAHALVLPSLAEGLPVVLTEAFAAARPVITTPAAGVPELVSPACGWLVEPGNPRALTDALHDALTAPDAELKARGQTGRQRVQQRHRVAEEVARLQDAIAGHPERPRD